MLQKAEPVRFTSPFAPYTGTPTITFLEPPAELTPPVIPSETATDSASQPREIEAGHTGTSEATTSAVTAGTVQTRERLLALRRLCIETLGGNSPFLEPALATYIANMRLHGSVVWLLMVAPPSSGKTLIIHLLAGLPCTLEADDISFGGLLSNCKKSERLANATGGLLREVDALGGTAVILASDLTEYLNEFTDKRSIMGAFRHVCDGHWNRANGADGGSRNIWGGRVGFIGGITGMVDGSNSIRSSMGERFLYFRSHQTLTESFRRALNANMISELERESRIREGVEALIDTIPQNPAVPTPGSMNLRITSLATVIGVLRTSVPRGSLVGAATTAPEGPTRLTQQLTSLYRGLLAIGCTAAEAWKTILKVAQDSSKSTPYQVFKQLLVEPGEAVPTPRIAEALGRRTEDPAINRILHGFAALGLIEEIDPRATRNSWVLTSEAYEICRYAFIDDMPEPSPEEIADIMGCDAPIAILTEGPTVIAAGDSSVADDEDTPPDEDGGGGGGLSLPQPPLVTSEPDFDHDDGQDEFMGFDIRQAE
ncbi:MAG TPA: hypothetical protein PLX54_07985 [Candidatus Fermentibacter daniensis]|nr:hypothetical protein [Candidatus Fermentibacter daniensis]HOR07085.1 hypothetical protein [Candidatus Fermentibacter daniensis]HPK52294.1 hypothetical protein [Candidatus Fermentibacter daniensis]